MYHIKIIAFIYLFIYLLDTMAMLYAWEALKSFRAPTLQCEESDLTLGKNLGTVFVQSDAASQLYLGQKLKFHSN